MRYIFVIVAPAHEQQACTGQVCCNGQVNAAGGLGAYSSVKNGIILAEPIISYDGKKITWDALKGATKYEVYVCKDLMEGGNELLKTTTSCSVSAKSGQGYGYRVLAVYNIDGKTYKSPLSNPIIT